MTPAYLPAPPYECRRKPITVSATVKENLSILFYIFILNVYDFFKKRVCDVVFCIELARIIWN